MKIENVAVYGLEESVRRSKYPMAVDAKKCTSDITARTVSLGSCPTGTAHDQFLTGVIVQFDITGTLKWWTEAQRYHWFEFVSSQSTMHRIAKFNPEEQCNEYVHPFLISMLNALVEEYNEDPTQEKYLTVLYNIPTGFQLTAGMTTNYRQLKTMYQQRKTHRLKEWRDFCDWCETLPHFMELCFNK